MSAQGDDKLVRVGIEIDPTDAQSGKAEVVKAFDDISNAAQRQASTTASSWKKAWDIIKTGLLALGASFSAFRLVGFIRESIELASRFETLGVVMNSVGKGAGYSAGYLAKLELELRKTGISMKESRQTIISMIQAQLDLNNATALARVAQNAAVTANLNSSETLNRLMVAVQSGNSIIARTIGLQVNWEKSYNDLALTLKKGVGALTETEKAQARVNAVMAAGKPVADAYEASMGTAAKQMRSSERYMEDLKTVVGTAFNSTYTAAVFAYADALKGVARWVMDNGPLVQGVVKTTLVMGALTATIYALNAALVTNAGVIAAWSLALASSPLFPFLAVAGLIAVVMGKNAAATESARVEMDKYITTLRERTPADLERQADLMSRRSRQLLLEAQRIRETPDPNRTNPNDRSLNLQQAEEITMLTKRSNDLMESVRRFRLTASDLRGEGSPEAVRAAKTWEQAKQTVDQLIFDTSKRTGIEALQQQVSTLRAALQQDIDKGYWTAAEGREKLDELAKKEVELLTAYRRNLNKEFESDRAAAAQQLNDQRAINEAYRTGSMVVDQLSARMELNRQIKEKTKNLDRDLGPGAAARVEREMRDLVEAQRQGATAKAFAEQGRAVESAERLAAASTRGAEAVDAERRAQERRLSIWQAVGQMGLTLGLIYDSVAQKLQRLAQVTNHNVEMTKADERIARAQQEAQVIGQGTEAVRKLRLEFEVLDAMRDYRAKNPLLSTEELAAYEARLRALQALTEANGKYLTKVQEVEATAKEIRTNTLRQMQQAFSDTMVRMLDNGLKSWKDFFNTVRLMFLRLVADLISAQLMKQLIKIMYPGSERATAAERQVNAGLLMLRAAEKQEKAAIAMANAAGSSTGTTPGGGGAPPASGGAGARILGTLSVAATAFSLGNMIGGSTTNRPVGVLGSMGAGAAAGAAIGSVVPVVGTAVGAAVGAVAGLVGGLMGLGRSSKAAAEEAKRFKEASTALAASMAITRARVAGNNTSLMEALEQNRQYFNKLEEDIRNTYTGKKRERDRFRLYREARELEQLEEQRIRAEFARKQKETSEDLRVRELRARSLNREADAMGLALQQQREYEEAVRAGFTEAQLAQLKYVHSLEQVKAATEGAVSALTNAPSGFKVALERFVATNPLVRGSVNPLAGAATPGLSLAESDTPILLVMDGQTVARGVVKNLQKKAQARFGTTVKWSEVQD